MQKVQMLLVSSHAVVLLETIGVFEGEKVMANVVIFW